ncbi:MAG: c-type cytochrome [Halothiobacillaceae bacterium]
MLKSLVMRAVLAASMVASGSVLAADIQAGRAAASACAACHGMDGNSANPAFPSIAGQGEKYLAKQLADYRSGARANSIMGPQAANLSDEDIANLAAFYASQELQFTPADEASEGAEALYVHGQPEDGIASCAACHGPLGKGNSLSAYPRLRGLTEAYVTASLQGYRDGSRANDAQRIMREVAENLTDDQIADLARYIASMP